MSTIHAPDFYEPRRRWRTKKRDEFLRENVWHRHRHPRGRVGRIRTLYHQLPAETWSASFHRQSTEERRAPPCSCSLSPRRSGGTALTTLECSARDS